MGKRADLGTVDCSYCNRTVRKRHPAQLICGKHTCRLASKRRYEGITFTCDNCGDSVQRKRSNQRFCSKEDCQKRSKYGLQALKAKVTCLYCKKTVVAKSTKQVTCLADGCRKANVAAIRARNRDHKRTGETFKCRYCPEVIERRQDNQLTCSSDVCKAARSAERADERRLLALRRKPKICPVCFDPILEKRFRTHPKCSKPIRRCGICNRAGLKKGCRYHFGCRKHQENDKRRLERNKAQLTQAKAKAFAAQGAPKEWKRRNSETEALIDIRLHRARSLGH